MYFEVDENSLLRYRRYRQKNPDEPLKPVSELDIECRMQLADETAFHILASLTSSRTIEFSNGSIQVRGKLLTPAER